ncbi:MAG: flagellar biosynthesis anti-sigma factor FlgM [Thermoanaerobacteraceae bacterium]|nr:flagellar biosynthesis anti-sigma factor FlgM [Thermoanaerobacteraceae bacterium]
MKVDGVNLRQVLSAYSSTKARPEKPESGSDKLEVGDFYKNMEEAKNVKLPSDPRIEEIKTSLKEGAYNVPTEKVAEKMIEDILLSMKIKRGGAQ